MADPFSIIGLVGVTLKSILQVKDLIDTVQRSPRSIEALGDELSTIAGLLRELGYLADSPDELNLNRIVREPLANCEKVSKQIKNLIQPYVKTSGGITKWGRFAFGFKESDVLLLQRDMSACKQNLTLAITSADLITTQKVVRGMRRVQNHFGIPSSSIAQSDIDERKHERIEDWVVETETVVEEEEEEEPLDTAGGSMQQTEPSRSGRQQGENSIQLPGSNHSGRQSPNHSRISNSSTPDGNEVSDPYEPLRFRKRRGAIAPYAFDGEQPGDLKFHLGDLTSVTKMTSSTNGWSTGSTGGISGARSGTFPSNSVEMRTSSVINPQPPAKGSQMPPRKFKEASLRNGRAMNPSSINLTVCIFKGYGFHIPTYCLEFEGKDTIAKVKTEFVLRAGHLKGGDPVSWKGQILDDKFTLDQYGIKTGDELRYHLDSGLMKDLMPRS